MNKYHVAISALRWLNENTDYRSSNISADFPEYMKTSFGGMFSFSRFSTKESLAIYTGNQLIERAKELGWEYQS
jgi:hypothetical protein